MEAGSPAQQARSQLESIMVIDAAWCRKRLSEIQRRLKQGQAADRQMNQVLQRIERSRARVDQRRAALPQPAYAEDLPITAHRAEILEAIGAHQVVILAGETGSGKTTQLPKLCLEAGRGTRGLVACTQPRRIAAQAMAERVAEELN